MANVTQVEGATSWKGAMGVAGGSLDGSSGGVYFHEDGDPAEKSGK